MSKELKKVDINGNTYNINGNLRYFHLSNSTLIEYDDVRYVPEHGRFECIHSGNDWEIITDPIEINENLLHSVNRVFKYTLSDRLYYVDGIVDYNAVDIYSPVKLYNLSDTGITVSALHCIPDNE